MRKYMNKRYHNRMDAAKELLGGKCIRCGSTEKLQLDHIDPSTKEFAIGTSYNKAEKVFWEEVKKCQLLCPSCHQDKTRKDLGQLDARTTHGTLSSHRYCKCDLCRMAWNEHSKLYKREWRKRKRAYSSTAEH